jgi:PAS domain S-box-containing protein
VTETISKASAELARENEALRAQLAEAQEVIRAIQSGDVDAVVVSGAQGEQIFTLKGAEYAYRALVEAMNEGAATLGEDGIVLYCNQRLSDLLEIPLELIIGRPASQLVGNEARQQFETLLADALSGDAAKSELELQSSEGRSIPVYVSLREMKGDDPTALCMVVTDLTEQKKNNELLAAEEALRKQAELLKLSYDAIIVWQLGGGIESWNIGAELLYGFTEREAMGRVTHELLKTIHPKPWSEIEAELLEKGTWEGELRHRARDGREIIVSARKQIIRDADGTKRVLETNRDITERKRIELAMRQSEARYQALFGTLIEGFCIIEVIFDPFNHPIDYRFLEVNPAFEMQTGLHDVQGKLMRDLAQEHEEHWFEIYGKVALTGEPVRFENEAKALDRWYDVSAYRVGGPESRRVAILFNDITERRRAEQALIQSEKLASVGRMASTIAHEINNPLETVGNAVYLALTDPGSSPEAKSYLKTAVEELDRVTHITRQTLAFHRENTKPTLIDLRESIDSLLIFYAPRLKARGIELEKRYAEVDPILATGGEVRQVISNLLTNSMDALTRNGKIHIRISRSIVRNGTQGVRFTIADTGSGICPESLKKIFEPFFTTKEVIGTGLGLWVTKQIVEKHGATIRVRSKPGKGAVFSVAFPSVFQGNGERLGERE